MKCRLHLVMGITVVVGLSLFIVLPISLEMFGGSQTEGMYYKQARIYM